METLFYSHHEKILFLIPTYYVDSGIENVKELTERFNNHVRELVEASEHQITTEQVKTWYIESSSRYKYMRAFYAHCEKPPKEAFIIGSNCKADDPNKWTMGKWLSD